MIIRKGVSGQSKYYTIIKKREWEERLKIKYTCGLFYSY